MILSSMLKNGNFIILYLYEFFEQITMNKAQVLFNKIGQYRVKKISGIVIYIIN